MLTADEDRNNTWIVSIELSTVVIVGRVSTGVCLGLGSSRLSRDRVMKARKTVIELIENNVLRQIVEDHGDYAGGDNTYDIINNVMRWSNIEA